MFISCAPHEGDSKCKLLEVRTIQGINRLMEENVLPISFWCKKKTFSFLSGFSLNLGTAAEQ